MGQFAPGAPVWTTALGPNGSGWHRADRLERRIEFADYESTRALFPGGGLNELSRYQQKLAGRLSRCPRYRSIAPQGTEKSIVTSAYLGGFTMAPM